MRNELLKLTERLEERKFEIDMIEKWNDKESEIYHNCCELQQVIALILVNTL